MIPPEATLNQIDAADPSRSTWVSANAGSGKTRVLTDRVALLLLKGAAPQNILCLTYTKAAASEMQRRLFQTLGTWSMLPDDDLRAALAGLGVQQIDDLARARRLFAAAIETPGGLKIQTIHSFCASILRRFPLEAGISPDFEEIDDRSARLLRDEVLDAMANGAGRAELEALAEIFTGHEIDDLAREILGHRAAFEQPVSEGEVWRWFDLPAGFADSDVVSTCFTGDEARLFSHVIPVFRGESSTMQKLAAVLDAIDLTAPGKKDLETLYEALLLGSAGAKRPEPKFSRIPTTKAKAALGPWLEPFEAFMQRVADSRERELRLEAARRTLTLHRFAHTFVTQYESAKRARGWLDFEDLISLAGRLLEDPALASWVLFRLDGGIDHILVDEAQDTSPAQWRVIDSLAREFAVGESARSLERTLFVVGDIKQSIYSFQGANPDGFWQMFEKLGRSFRQVGHALREARLSYSFRSSRTILDVVDHTLEGLPGVGQDVKHIAANNDFPGRVDLWPPVAQDEGAPEPNWSDPVDVPSPRDAGAVLADRIAETIKSMLDNATLPNRKGGGRRRVRAGDILILVRKRSRLFYHVIRACKALGLPIAGADKLRVEAELAVKDLTATLAFLATPEDDLSLAAALRSPLFNLSEQDIFSLAHGRGRRYLWQVLRERRDAFPQVVEILDDMRSVADFLRPYDILERLLSRHGGRRRLKARLGPECEDGIDALLAQALAYERTEVPSLTGFLTWFGAEKIEIKRQLDNAGDLVRVMTVHGAKGLEAPIVFLPDTAVSDYRNTSNLVSIDGGVAFSGGGGPAPGNVSAAIEREKEKSAREEHRLLYVAMTRAESWLIVACAGKCGEEGDQGCWYRLVEAGMRRADVVDCD
ncbi:MAG: double-strand break repair helicase AddA, partial [Alphaproteobacteria bacterium]